MNTKVPRMPSIVSLTIALAIGTGPNFARSNGTPLAGEPVGAKVYVQTWNPLTPDQDAPKTAFASADGIRVSMNDAWDAARVFLSDPTKSDPSQVQSLRAILEKGNLIAKGITLRFLKFNLNPLGPIDLQSNGPNSLRIHWQIPDSYFDFKSTTPDVNGVGLSRDTDPEFSFRFNLDITLGAAVSDQPGVNLLTITDVNVVPSALNFDSHNPTGDAVRAAADAVSHFLKGQDFNTLLNSVLANQNLASRGVNGNVGLKDFVNQHLRPLNQEIAQSGIANYVRVGLYIGRNPSAQMLTLLFSVKSLPPPPQQAGINGTLHFDPKPNQGPAVPGSCDNFIAGNRLEVTVQTGPRGIVDVNPFADAFNYGVAPIATLQNVKFSGGPVAGSECSYQLAGLATGWSNQIRFVAPSSQTNGNDVAAVAYWDIQSKAGLNSFTTCPANVNRHSTEKIANMSQFAETKPAAVNWSDPSIPAASPSPNATPTQLNVRNSTFLRSEVRAFGARTASGSAMGPVEPQSCTHDYDLIARTAFAVNQGRIVGKARFLKPGEAVQNQAVQGAWGERQIVSPAPGSSLQAQRLHSMQPQPTSGELTAPHAPTRWNGQAVEALKPGQANAINPQPLPPKPASSLSGEN